MQAIFYKISYNFKKLRGKWVPEKYMIAFKGWRSFWQILYIFEEVIFFYIYTDKNLVLISSLLIRETHANAILACYQAYASA